ncbi:uncharacterized protein LOC113680179 isoform X1 [Pocillopora damicornis]|uniref:uncharacterized protein LOC113680179 isoform X1 n=1 Tax=Pocillopora damicornis TaxID=46731 RepID=UPI000F5509F5|nr:uncharacterized protein LOC113680179 isoform X1 [Pocillopora damicornis]
MAAAMMPVPETNSHGTDSPNYRDKYKTLKRKLKFLLYEQEYFQEELRRVQKKLLRVSRDKSFLLDRLLHYENVDHSSSDDEGTASSSGVSDSEGPKVPIAENPPPSSNNSRPKKTQVVNHGIPADSMGMFPYPSSDGTSSAGGELAAASNKKSIQCQYVNNGTGDQCQERISKRSKSGYCSAHRSVIRISKQAGGTPPKQLNTNTKPILESQRDNSSMVDQQQLERLNQLSESSSCTTSQVPQATEELPQEMFNVEDDERDSENEDSPGSSSFHGNIYEGDDDLVIDLPE